MAVSFILEQFEKFIDAQGYDTLWSQAIVCQCFENPSGQPDMHCPYCKGSGYRYLPPKRIKAITTSFSGQKELKIQGLAEPGSAYITPQIGIIMGFRDRVEFPEIECKYTQILRFEGEKTNATYREIRKVLFVMSDNRVYEEGIDFEITQDRHRLQWISPTTMPDTGSNISILYMTTPAYLITDLSHELRSTQEHKGTREPYTVELPKQYMIRRENFIYGAKVNAKVDFPPENEEFYYE